MAESLQDLRAFNIAFKGYKDGSIDFYGDQIEAATGYLRREFQSREVLWTDLIVREDRDQTREAFVYALKHDKTYTRQYRIRSKSGQILWIQEWSQIVCNETGEVDYVTGIIVDITRSKLDELARLECEKRTGKYLTFFLGGQDYGVSLLKVKEIIELLPITPVPNAPHSIKGVINLRGKVIPVMDLKERLGVTSETLGERRCIIVVDVARPGGAMLAGLLVDGVSDVVFFRGENIDNAPASLPRSGTEYILGMAKLENSVRLLLDTDRTFQGIDVTFDDSN